MVSRKSHRPMSAKTKAHSAQIRGKSTKMSAKASKKPARPVPRSVYLIPSPPPSFPKSELLIPTPSMPAPSLPSSSPVVSEAPMTDGQTHQMLKLGQRCYSLFGQTRLFWSQLKDPIADHEWLRFHFLQSSMLSTMFFGLYALFGLGILLDLLGAGFVPLGLFEFIFLLVLILHLVLFRDLGQKAVRGEVPMLPLIGPHAALLAASGKPLDAWKL